MIQPSKLKKVGLSLHILPNELISHGLVVHDLVDSVVIRESALTRMHDSKQQQKQ
jgi:hypothetical protein